MTHSAYSSEDLRKGIGFSSTINLWTNTAVIWEVLRVMLITLAIFCTLMLLISGFDLNFAIVSGGITGAILIGLTLLAYYLIYCPLNRGRYRNNYVMTDKKITGYMGVQTAETADKLAATGIVLGILTGNLTTIGVGMLSSRREMTSTYRQIKKITYKRHSSALILSGSLARNVIFVPDGYLDAVADSIIQHCPDTVKVKGR